jgi:medium-chain acyl-[acyl-carrier-protein] hydrolase
MSGGNGICWAIPVSHASKPRLKLLCFPFAGGGASAFRFWINLFPPDISVYAVQLPGRESRVREPSFTKMLPLAIAATEGLLPLLGERFAFFGYSMGAILAFEVARHLHRIGREGPDLLIAAASPAPQLSPKSPITFNLPEGELIEKLRELEGTPLDVLENADLMQLILPVIRADFEAVETYEYQNAERLKCMICALGGSADPRVGSAELKGWHAQTSGSFSYVILPGNHFFLTSVPELVARLILPLLRNCRRLT